MPDPGNNQQTANATPPNQTPPAADAPQRFRIGDKLMTFEEAQAALAKAAANETELQQTRQRLTAHLDDLGKMLNNKDQEAFRRSARAAGWSDERINGYFNSLALQNAARKPVNAAQPDTDDEEDDDPPATRTPHRPTQNGSELTLDSPEVVSKLANAVMGSPAMKEFVSRMMGAVGPMAEQSLGQSVRSALEADPTVGKLMKSGGKGSDRLFRDAMVVAKSKFREAGGFAPSVVEAAVATARSTADDFGLLEDRTPSPNLGGLPSQSFGGFEPPKERKAVFDVNAEDIQKETGEWLAGLMKDAGASAPGLDTAP